MGKIVLDRSGELRFRAFYRFHVPFDDGTEGLPRTPEWIVVPRTPKEGEQGGPGTVTWMWMSGLGEPKDRVVTKDCPLDPNHETRWHYERFTSEIFGGKKISPFIATSIGDAFALSDDLKCRLEAIHVRGSRIDPTDVTVHITGKKVAGFWALQFIGKVSLRMPRIVGAPNRCPYCARGSIFCEGCGEWVGSCPFCKKDDLAIREDKYEGTDDKRIPFEANLWNIIEGRGWDGSDVLQAHGEYFASKRFIDWLLRIHAAPFYAEPVWFCVDGMSDQQKKWFDELQKPLET